MLRASQRIFAVCVVLSLHFGALLNTAIYAQEVMFEPIENTVSHTTKEQDTQQLLRAQQNTKTWKSHRYFNLVKPLDYPLNIYVQPWSDFATASKYHAYVHDALEQWSKALNGRLKYQFINTSKGADIEIYWNKPFKVHDPKRTGETNSQIGHCAISVKTTNRADNWNHQTVVHEIGHSLGLGHSQDPGDMMYGNERFMSTNEYINYVPHLSDRDLMAIQWLYSSNWKPGEDIYAHMPATQVASRIPPPPVTNPQQPVPSTLLSRNGIDYTSYMVIVQKLIYGQWKPPYRSTPYTVDTLFQVDKKGIMRNPRILKSTGSIHDNSAVMAALQAVKSYPPVPPQHPYDSMNVHFTFTYNVYGHPMNQQPVQPHW